MIILYVIKQNYYWKNFYFVQMALTQVRDFCEQKSILYNDFLVIWAYW